tara:strand:- start:1545 stop:3095 length:1551 start_codon:yes stop_codon:yes gene_type:complete
MVQTGRRDFETAARAALNAHEASEVVRRYQQGFGRPIISTKMDSYRIVAVGKTIKWSKGWRFFTDFLVDHLKDVIGRPWAIQAQREKKSHPIFTWLATMSDVAAANRATNSTAFLSNGKGHLGALWKLGYALYLIQHNDELDPKIVKRLRSPVSFRATYHETQIASAFAVSGFKIKMAETGRTSKSSPEFWAARKNGLRYGVEAKCKNHWNSAPDVDSVEFQNELRQWIRNQLYNASVKKLQNAIYCFELSLFADLDKNQWNAIAEQIKAVLKEAESLKIKGQAPVPAYVIVTNNVDVLRNQDFTVNRVAMLFGYCMQDWYDNGVEVEIETAFDSHDKHQDVHTVFKCFEEIDEIPQSFDGTPTILDENGNMIPMQTRVGNRIEFPDANGSPQVGLIYDITTANNEAWLCVESNGEHQIVKMQLAPHEIAAVKRYGDAVFGKPEEKRKNLEGDPLKFYDWIMSVFENYDRKALLVQIQNHHDFEKISELPDDQLRIRAAREVTKAAIATSGRPRQV